MKILVALTFVQIVSRISCLPATSYVISSYSNVRVQQPTMGLSVESPMPMEIMMNPVLADEPPAIVDKMEGIFMKGDQMKNIKTMNIDEEEIMMSINKQTSQQINNENEKIVENENEKIVENLNKKTVENEGKIEENEGKIEENEKVKIEEKLENDEKVENIFEDLMALGTEKPAAFSIPTDISKDLEN